MDSPSATDPFRTRVSLLNRLQNLEDRSSWQEFFRHYKTVIHGVALRRGLKNVEAEEVVMEVFCRVAQTIHDF